MTNKARKEIQISKGLEKREYDDTTHTLANHLHRCNTEYSHCLDAARYIHHHNLGHRGYHHQLGSTYGQGTLDVLARASQVKTDYSDLEDVLGKSSKGFDTNVRDLFKKAESFERSSR
tara:strand:- start:193 stop:546 length:354 start_codon:yes stop_codon:yes gene_type:complete